jgi:hypothetical protein
MKRTIGCSTPESKLVENPTVDDPTSNSSLKSSGSVKQEVNKAQCSSLCKFWHTAKWADEHPFEVTDDILQDNIIEIECECGNTFKRKLPKELVWEETDSNERELGTERCYEAKFTCNCPECIRELAFTCQAWEYPEGKLDMLNIICDHAIVLNEISDLDLNYPFIDYEEEI